MSSDATAAVISCRRCGQPFVLPARPMVLPACPQCGASPSPLLRGLRTNRWAATFALLALLVLVPSFFLPFVSMAKLGERHVFSLLGGILELFNKGNHFLGGILLVFSVLFPVAKLLLLLAATSALMPLSDRMRHSLHHLAVVTGKYSLLDLLVVALMIVLVKFRNLAEVEALPGTVMFGTAILFSIVAGLCVNLDHRTTR